MNSVFFLLDIILLSQANLFLRYHFLISKLRKHAQGETNGSIDHLFATEKLKALPDLKDNIKCGNSLVDKKFYKYKKASMLTTSDLESLNPFDFEKQFRNVFKQKGFDVIIGNPPYTRIQTMKKIMPLELEYYQSKHSKYLCAEKDNFDKYMLFIERAVQLLKDGGRLGCQRPPVKPEACNM